MATPIVTPAEARFTCQSCGRCCKGWAVPVDEQTVERLRQINWGGEPFERGRSGDTYQIRLVDERCFFLDDDDRCRIHTEVSYEAKPAVCRAFPLTVLELNGQRYARLSYWCPTVAVNAGRPLEQQLRWVRDVARHADRRTAPLTLDGVRELTGGSLERIHRVMRQFLDHTSGEAGDGLAAAAALVNRLRVTNSLSGPAFEAALRAIGQESLTDLAAETRRRGRAGAGWRVLAAYLLEDRVAGRFTAITRAVEVWLAIHGLLPLRSRAVRAAVWRGRLARVTLGSGPRGLLERYVTRKLDSRRYVAGELSVAAGLNLLTAAYAVAHLLARLKAASAGAAACSDEDMALAVGAADLLVLEHPVSRGRIHQQILKPALESADTGADLLSAVAS